MRPIGIVSTLFGAVWLAGASRPNATFYNPVLPGFHPDPSCIFVREWDSVFFCASSSFNVFPGIPIHASKDLTNWKLIGHALNRREQLPRLAETNRSTSGIWAPALRFHDDTFWLVTTLVDDDRPQEDASRWDNIIFKTSDPYVEEFWSNATHFDFEGYDPEPFFDDDGKTYIVGAHAWRVEPGIHYAEANLETGEVGEWKVLWEGTGGMAPEGPHIYKKDGFYYLLAAEGGTGLDHMITIARSESIDGPYESNPANPILSNANTTNYFQTVGHGDLLQDKHGNWWAFALSTRSGPEYLNFPLVRETVMAAARWEEGEWPIVDQVRGVMTGPLPEEDLNVGGSGPWIVEGDDVDFSPGTSLPPHFVHWRFPIEEHFTVSSAEDHPNTLRISPSDLNLTALNGNYAGPTGQAFVGRRQQETLFTYSVTLDFNPSVEDEEAGVSAFLTQNHHLDMGVVMLPASARTASFPGEDEVDITDEAELIPHFRFRGMSYIAVPEDVIAPVPADWVGKPLRMEISARNATHYSFSAGPADARSQTQTLIDVSNEAVSWGFTGVLVGVYATSNGGEGSTPAYVSDWKYVPQAQFRD